MCAEVIGARPADLLHPVTTPTLWGGGYTSTLAGEHASERASERVRILVYTHARSHTRIRQAARLKFRLPDPR